MFKCTDFNSLHVAKEPWFLIEYSAHVTVQADIVPLFDWRSSHIYQIDYGSVYILCIFIYINL